ncbi:hypothetical protein [Tepidiforma bonchosmolovskayae]|uniref:Uncharacterized protein n=1 Tax=Tepidiforma bonchosmolovskayae TaxID=2601677 RepID=A0ABX6BYW3_9CHLR|nr:hypothetical protein [Tepidiforma bonchosmolovskayae]QFG02177.1 hypothetical protein Tbon_02315 [Tepidiforma bonchosmolovskayae]
MATPKQIDYAVALIEKAGYGRYLSSKLAADLPRDISFSSRDAARLQSVKAWMTSLSTAQASELISWLQSKTPKAS